MNLGVRTASPLGIQPDSHICFNQPLDYRGGLTLLGRISPGGLGLGVGTAFSIAGVDVSRDRVGDDSGVGVAEGSAAGVASGDGDAFGSGDDSGVGAGVGSGDFDGSGVGVGPGVGAVAGSGAVVFSAGAVLLVTGAAGQSVSNPSSEPFTFCRVVQ